MTPAFEEQLASVLRKNNYEMTPLLETILLSRDFYSESSMGTQIKAPVQLVVSTYRKMGLTVMPTVPIFQSTTRDWDRRCWFLRTWPDGKADAPG